jgi:hypothetical protein
MCPGLQQYFERPTGFLKLAVQNLISDTGIFQRMSDLREVRDNRIIEGPTEVGWKGRMMRRRTIVRRPFCGGWCGGI